MSDGASQETPSRQTESYICVKFESEFAFAVDRRRLVRVDSPTGSKTH
jgi:hypothetical protein